MLLYARAVRKLLLLALPLAGLAIAQPAWAGTVSIDTAARTLVYQGDPGPNNVDVFVTFRERTGTYSVNVRDFDADNTTDSPLCAINTVGDAECELDFAPVELLSGGAGNDTLETSSARFVTAGHRVDGQEGDDAVQGGPAAETLIGGSGNDKLSSDGGPTLTTLPVGPNDVLIGGDGIDEVSYQQADGPSYSLTLDGVANDGAPGENDNIASDVENLTAAISRPSVLVGNGAANLLQGFDGNDTLDGGGGNDVLAGGGGNDALDGGAGDDALEGGSEDDRLTGGPGKDSFSGDFSGSFNQTIVGNDAIFARDGVAESVSCGPGADTAQVDTIDTVAGDPQNGCETVDKAVGKPASRKPSVRSSALRVRANRVATTIACPATGPGCVGTLRLRTIARVRVGSKRTTAVLASGSYPIAAGKSKTVSVRLGATGRAVLRRSKSLRVRVELRAPGARLPTATRTVTLRR